MKVLLWPLLCFSLLCLGAPIQKDVSRQEVELLQVGIFHAGQVSAKSGEIWWGLYLHENGYQLLPSTLTVEQAPDSCNDEDEGTTMTASKVSVDQAGEPLFLVKGLPVLSRGPVRGVFAGYEFIYPGQYKSFELSEGNFFDLVAFGEAFDGGVSQPFDIRVRNYKIVISHMTQSQVIATLKAVDQDSPPRLLWAGDLDRDGKLDVWMDLTEHYNGSTYTLFLSSQARGYDLVRKVAVLETYGC